MQGYILIAKGSCLCAQEESSTFIILYKILGGEGGIEKVEGDPEASKVATKEEGSGTTVKMAPTEKQPAEFQKALQDFIDREKKTEGMNWEWVTWKQLLAF